MQYHVIIGVGFSEMRTAAIKLKDKLVEAHGADAVITQVFGSLRNWKHNAEVPEKAWKQESGHDGLGNLGTKIIAKITDKTKHCVIWGPGTLSNMDKVLTHLVSNNKSTPNVEKLTSGHTLTAYILKTKENVATLVDNLKKDYDQAESKGHLLTKGTGLVNPTDEQIQAAKDKYYEWCTTYVAEATDLWSNYDDEDWSAWGGWNADGTPTQVGAGMTDVTSYLREDGTTANFTNNTAQYYITTV